MNGIQQSTINHMVTRFKNERSLDATYDARMLGSYAYVQFHVSTPNPFPELRVGPQGGWYSDAQCRGGEIRTFPNPAMGSLLYADDRLSRQNGRRQRGTSRVATTNTSGPAHYVMAREETEQARDRLACILKDLACLPKCKEKLAELKNDASTIEDPAFVWRSIIESLSGWGSSAGYERLIRHKDYQKLDFDSLSAQSPEDRLAEIEKLFRDAVPRYWRKKSVFLIDNLTKIQTNGGLQEVKKNLLDQPTRDTKIKFLRQFRGISLKFARNIFMNVYHDQFRQSVAVDDRIKSISKELGLSFSTYEDEEQFYLDVAKKADLDGWDVDRLIYNFTDDVLSHLRQD